MSKRNFELDLAPKRGIRIAISVGSVLVGNEEIDLSMSGQFLRVGKIEIDLREVIEAAVAAQTEGKS